MSMSRLRVVQRLPSAMRWDLVLGAFWGCDERLGEADARLSAMVMTQARIYVVMTDLHCVTLYSRGYS